MNHNSTYVNLALFISLWSDQIEELKQEVLVKSAAKILP